MIRRRRLLTIGLSYCVAGNRRLAHELALTGDWDVTVVGPARFRGDFRVHDLVRDPRERCAVEPVPVYVAGRVHTMVYGWRLRELLRQYWDLVHCWEEPYVASAAQVAAWTPSRVPLVFATFQNIDKRYPPPFSWFEQYSRGRADGLVAFGRTVFDVAAARGYSMTRARIIPPGVDTVRFAPNAEARRRVRAHLDWVDETPVVGFLGRFVPEKGLRLLTAVLDRLRTPWRALFVGSGPLESELRKWARRHDGRVALATTVDHDAVPDWLTAMDVLCAPSRTTPHWREQFGRMLIEAFAAGVPVVASDSGEIPYVVADSGIIVGERDADGWARALSALLPDVDRRAALAQQGRDRAVREYDWPVVARRQSQYFRDLIEGTTTKTPQALSAVDGAGV
jgi:glycosyltransferase involved in cell wall biosynthesis